MQMKVRNLVSGAIIPMTFDSGKKLEGIETEKKRATFSYEGEDAYVFMDTETYEELEVPKAIMGELGKYLDSDMKVQLDIWNERVTGFNLNSPIICKIAEVTNKDNSRDKQSIRCILENGVELKGPYYLKAGDDVRICPKNFVIQERVN